MIVVATICLATQRLSSAGEDVKKTNYNVPTNRAMLLQSLIALVLHITAKDLLNLDKNPGVKPNGGS